MNMMVLNGPVIFLTRDRYTAESSRVKTQTDIELSIFGCRPKCDVDYVVGAIRSPMSTFCFRSRWSNYTYRLTARTEPIQLKWLGSAEPPQIKNVALLEKLNTRYVENLDVQSQQLAQTLWQRSRQNPERYIAEVLQWYKQNRFAYTLSPV